MLFPEIIATTSRIGRKMKHFVLLELHQACNNLAAQDKSPQAVSALAMDLRLGLGIFMTLI